MKWEKLDNHNAIQTRWITNAIFRSKKKKKLFKERMLSSVAKKAIYEEELHFFRYEKCKMRAMILIYVC